jgi:hypothetical protein
MIATSLMACSDAADNGPGARSSKLKFGHAGILSSNSAFFRMPMYRRLNARLSSWRNCVALRIKAGLPMKMPRLVAGRGIWFAETF